MKKTVQLTLVLLGLSLANLLAQPKITFKEKVHNFGDILETDGFASHVFEFTNTGDAPLIIQRVSSSCGCTTPKWTQSPVEPGEKGIVKATYNPHGRPGGFSKSITVFANVKEQYIRLAISGNVLPKGQESQLQRKYPIQIGGIRINTRTVRMNDVNKGKIVTKTIGVVNVSPQKANITIENLPKGCQVSNIPATLEPNKTGEINITFDSNKTDEWGNISTDLHILLNGKKIADPNNKISLSANVVEDFSQMTIAQKREAPITEIKSSTLQFGNIKQGKKIKGKITLKNVGINPLKIRKINNANNDITIIPQKTTIAGGKKTQLHIYIDTAKLVKGKYQKSFSVQTNDPITTVIVYTLQFEII